MIKKSFLGEFVKYTSFNILGMLGISLYILADTFFVSNALGTNGLAALNLAIPVYSFIHGGGLMLGMGSATKYTIFKIQGDVQQADSTYTNTLKSAAVLSLFLVLMGVFVSRPISLALGASENIFEMTNTYLSVLLFFSPAFILNDILICFIRNDGNPRLSMAAMLGGSISNIILDYVFIFPLKMGIFGAVFATGLAPVISILILSIHFIKKKNGFHLAKVRYSLKAMKNVLALGLPSFITELSSGIVIIVFNSIILCLQGNLGVAAYGIIANISLVVTAIYTGIAQGAQPLISNSFGIGDYLSIKKLLRYSLSTMSIISLIIYLSIFIFSSPIVAIFNSENDIRLAEIASYGMKLYFSSILFMGFNIVMSAFFTSIENAFPAHCISLLRGLLLIVPMAYLLSSLLKLEGVWLSFPLTECLVAILSIVFYYKLGEKTCKDGLNKES